MDHKDIDFVARHYRRGLFDANRAWKAFGLRRSGIFRRWQIAASVAVLVAFGAVAAVVIVTRPDIAPQPQPATRQHVPTTIQAPAAHINESIAIDFDDAPLSDVVVRIEKAYGVTVENVPSDAADQHLTLHFEGNAADLIDTINALLGTEMTVQPQRK